MINIFSKLENEKNLTKSEQIVAHYILDNPENIMDLSVKQLAKKCYVSVNVIYRLCDKLDLGGFSDLKIKISQSYKDYVREKNEVDVNFPIKQYQTRFEVLESLKKNYEHTLSATFNLFDLEQIRHIVSKMSKAKMIDIYTSAQNLYFAENFKIMMREIGVIVEAPKDEYEQRLIASTSDEDHFAIVISYGGHLVNIDFIAQILKEKHTPILLISSCDYTFKEVIPNYHIYMSSQEHRYKKVSSFSSKLSLLYILDALYSCYFELDYDNNLKRKLGYYKILEYQKNEIELY